MILIKVFLFVAFLVLALLFAYYNLQEVQITLFNYSFKAPLFAVVLGSLGLGLVISQLFNELRILRLKRYAGALKEGLYHLWTGFPSKARKDLGKISKNEEVLPLYLSAYREEGKKPSLYFQEFSEGIAETEVALEIFREDTERAKDLLEKAVGKNPKNLRAKRALVALYFLSGELEKAKKLQEEVISESEKPLKDKEKEIYGSILAHEERGEDIDRYPPSAFTLAFLAFREGNKKGIRYLEIAMERDLHNEVLMVSLEKGWVSQVLMEFLEEKKDSFDPSVLTVFYHGLGMTDKAETLMDKVPEELLKMLKAGCIPNLWVCGYCGKEFSSFRVLCENCLSWNKLRIMRRE